LRTSRIARKLAANAKHLVRNDGAARSRFDPTGKSLSNFLSIPSDKNISLPTPPKSVACAARLVPKEGRLAIVTDVGNGMRWTLLVRLTKRAEADGEVVWS
jgi:hypothetical protein